MKQFKLFEIISFDTIEQAESLKYHSVGQRPTLKCNSRVSRGIMLVFQRIFLHRAIYIDSSNYVGRCPTL